MKIFVACPAPPRSRKGNRVTAVRWAGILKDLGHRPTIGRTYDGWPCDLLIALHARRSAAAVRDFVNRDPRKPVIVALTGTDLYRDIHTSKMAEFAIGIADRLVVLQERGPDELPPGLRARTRVIYQSAVPTRSRPAPGRRFFEVCVLGHLRGEKDPFRAALALRLLPADSRIRLTHAGRALTAAMARRAAALMRREPRYHWLGEVSAGRARRLLARSRLLVLSSRMEGGANVLSEAIAEGVPVLASRIPGNVGILGGRYPGFFPVGDTAALARLLRRAETDPAFYARLQSGVSGLAPLVDPARERAAWASLLGELACPPE
jgi:putative glycosyltransferase (TIGR04348 family)